MFRHHKLIGTSLLIGHLSSPSQRIRICRHSIHLEFLRLRVLRSCEDRHCIPGSHRAPVCLVKFLAVDRRTSRRQYRNVIEILRICCRIHLKNRQQVSLHRAPYGIRCKVIRGIEILSRCILGIHDMENTVLKFLVKIKFILFFRVLSLHQREKIIAFVPETNMGIIGEPVVIRDTGTTDTGCNLLLRIRKQVCHIRSVLHTIPEMESGIMGSDEGSLPRRASKPGRGNTSLKPRDL